MGLFRRKHQITQPLHGTAEVIKTWKPPQDGGYGNCKMQLALRVNGVEPRVVKHHEWKLHERQWPRVGQIVPVTVDAHDPTRVRVDWDTVAPPANQILGGLLEGIVDIDRPGGIEIDLGP